ncbi:MAG: dicarboxylate/amino acid:cation symporter [bacterium]|nr:dicarboxylate/amino acid:cation symporter [bacterium]
MTDDQELPETGGKPGAWARWNAITLWKRVMLGLLLGSVVGLGLHYGLGGEAAGAFTGAWLSPLGEAFVQLIRMLVVPLIFTSLASGVMAMGDPAKLGSVGLKSVALYMLTTLFAVSIGMVLGYVLRPGAGVDFAGVTPGELQSEAPSIAQRLIAIIPSNPFQALASGDILAVIFFAILLGVAVLVMGEKARPVGAVLEAGAEVTTKITQWVMELAPFGVFFLIATVTGEKGLSTFTSVALLALCVYLGCLLQIVLVYFGIIGGILRLPLRRFWRGVLDAQAVAYSTSSSSATMPVTLSCTRFNLGVSKAVASSVIPLGATINMDGTSLYLGVLALFAAQAFGIPLSGADYLVIAATAVLASIGTAGIPSASLFLLATVLGAIGATGEQIALMVGFLLPFDRLMDMMRTLTNVTGDITVAVAVAKSEGELDEGVFRSEAVV